MSVQTAYTDLFEKFQTDAGYFGPQRAHDDHYFTRPILDPHPDRVMTFQQQPVIIWSVNNYLGLANDETVTETAAEAVRTYGIGAPMGSRMMTGNTPDHLELERRLAEFAQKEAAFLFNYGYLGVMGTIASLVGPDDIVVVDKLAHACILDGAFLAPGQTRVFKHNNMDSLETVLKRVNRERKGGVLVVTEGVYGMTGDIAKLPEICELKNRYDARLFVDDAHGFGVVGDEGRGSGDYFGVQDDIDLYFGTFAKAFAAIGGFTATTQGARDWISYNARTQVFAKSLPMVYVKALETTLDLVRQGDDRRERMWENANSMKEQLRELGYYVGRGESPICSVFAPVGEQQVDQRAMEMMRFLRDRGVFCTAIAYPVIPLGLCMFRIIPTAVHTQEDVAHTVETFRRMRDELPLELSFGEEEWSKLRRIYGDKA
jgi:glycine C-acetyltransferase